MDYLIGIIEPFSSGAQLVYSALSRGYRVVVFKNQEGPHISLDEEIVNNVLVINTATTDENQLETIVENFHSHSPLNAILPGVDEYVPLVGRLCYQLGLPGPCLDCLPFVRLKHKLRQQLEKHQIPNSQFGICYKKNEAKRYANKVGYPLVVKAVDLAAAMCVSLARNEEELDNAISRIENFEDIELGGRQPLKLILLEEHLIGPEYSIEGIVQGNTVKIISITKKLLGPAPYFVLKEHVVCSTKSQDVNNIISEYILTVIHAIKLDHGIFHAELRITNRGPILLEIAARLPGDEIPSLIKKSTGVCLSNLMLDSFLGIKKDLSKINTIPNTYNGIRYVIRINIISYRKVIGIDQVKELPGFIKLNFFIKPGERIEVGDDSQRIASIEFQSIDQQILHDTLDKADSLLKFIQ